MSQDIEKTKKRLMLCFMLINAVFWMSSLILIIIILHGLLTKPVIVYVVLGGQIPVFILIVNASVVYVLGFIGICVGVRLNGACIKTYLGLSVIFLVLDGVLVYYFGNYTSKMTSNLEGTWFSSEVATIHAIQTQLHCCGFNGPDDYVDQQGQLDLIYSCYYENITGNVIIYTPYVVGCVTDLMKSARILVTLVYLICLIFMISEIAGIGIASYIIRMLRKRSTGIGIADPDLQANNRYTMIRDGSTTKR